MSSPKDQIHTLSDPAWPHDASVGTVVIRSLLTLGIPVLIRSSFRRYADWKKRRAMQLVMAEKIETISEQLRPAAPEQEDLRKLVEDGRYRLDSMGHRMDLIETGQDDLRKTLFDLGTKSADRHTELCDLVLKAIAK
jgi:hypothetical protein